MLAALQLFEQAILPTVDKNSPAYAAFVLAMSLARGDSAQKVETSYVPPSLHVPCNQGPLSPPVVPTTFSTPTLPCKNTPYVTPSQPAADYLAQVPSSSVHIETPRFSVGKATPSSKLAEFRKHCRDGKITRVYQPQGLQLSSPQEGIKRAKVVGTTTNTRAVHTPSTHTDENKDKNPHHSGEHLQQYSVQLRIEALDDYYHGMTIAQVCRKYNISNHRCVGRWLREFGNGKYDDAMSTWTLEERRKTYKVGNTGRKVSNAELEQILLDFMAELDECHLQFLSSFLIMEALDHFPNWLGGPDALRFMERAHDFVKRFKDRNRLAWRAPTTIGQKRPVGYEGKWRVCSEFYYVKTKGIPKKYNYNGDETKVLHEPVARRQLAKKGAKRVHARTSGGEKEGNSVFLGTDGVGEKMRPFIIFKGSTVANRPTSLSNKRLKKGTIREQIEDAKKRGLVDHWFDYWVNESGTMDEEAHCYMLERHFKRVRRECNEPHIRMSMLEDSHTSHRTERVKRTLKSLNVQLAIISGGLTGDAQLGDRVFIKRFKGVHRALLNRVLLGKWKEARRRLRKNNGFVGRPADIKIPPPDRIEQINLIVKAWKNTNTADIEAKTEEVRMKCYALAQETGWTPAKAFEDMPMDAELAAQVQQIHAHDQQVQGDIDNQETRTLTCLTKKCVRSRMQFY